MLRTVRDMDLDNKRVLLRVDFNVPIKDGVITDETRIVEALPTSEYILAKPGTSLVVMCHLGRPAGDGTREPQFSVKPIAKRLSEKLGRPVQYIDDVVGDKVEAAAKALKPGEILFLENVRYYKAEKKTIRSLRRSWRLSERFMLMMHSEPPTERRLPPKAWRIFCRRLPDV